MKKLLFTILVTIPLLDGCFSSSEKKLAEAPKEFEKTQQRDKKSLKQIYKLYRNKQDFPEAPFRSRKIFKPEYIQTGIDIGIQINHPVDQHFETMNFSLRTEITIYWLTSESEKSANSVFVCAYDSYLTSKSHMINELEVFGEPIQNAFDLRIASNKTNFSTPITNFQQLTSQQIMQFCNEIYRDDFADQVTASIKSLATNLRLNQPRKLCNSALEIASNTIHPECRTWAYKRGWRPGQKLIPRCLQKPGFSVGTGSCGLRSVEKGFCPLYTDSQHELHERALDLSSSLITEPSIPQYFCDEKLKLVCVKQSRKNRKPLGICRSVYSNYSLNE